MLLLALLHSMGITMFRFMASLCRHETIASTVGSSFFVTLILLGGFLLPRGAGLLAIGLLLRAAQNTSSQCSAHVRKSNQNLHALVQMHATPHVKRAGIRDTADLIRRPTWSVLVDDIKPWWIWFYWANPLSYAQQGAHSRGNCYGLCGADLSTMGCAVQWPAQDGRGDRLLPTCVSDCRDGRPSCLVPERCPAVQGRTWSQLHP